MKYQHQSIFEIICNITFSKLFRNMFFEFLPIITLKIFENGAENQELDIDVKNEIEI